MYNPVQIEEHTVKTIRIVLTEEQLRSLEGAHEIKVTLAGASDTMPVTLSYSNRRRLTGKDIF